ncbi:DUF3800 domain-containing protein [Desulfosporosinus sp. HMP52]|uniref:DUF3800 domain-containing protein n=1 Tax=Desulfosporosinus sp. HMP52 TaxID=1487923 RepID=UPI000FFF51BD|nr:DUF3800 domain-containing protein [Desulfosporosinus sp. HMP52]
MNEYSATRNSDLTLQLKYWEVFEDFDPTGENIKLKDLYKMERLTSITRARAKIQNEYGLFRADEKIRGWRRSKEEQEKEAQLADKPGIPSIYIYADESGKNQQFSMVGSIWIPDVGGHNTLHPHFIMWKKEHEDKGIYVPKEFHFTEMKRQQLEIYKEFFNEFYKESEFASFIAVAANNHNIRDNIDDTIFALYYQIVHLGIEHETGTNRISLPRQICYYKDEEVGTDKLKLAKLEQELKTRFKIYFEDQLYLSNLTPLQSSYSPMIQIADLFTGSISRILNKTDNDSRNHKDEFAEYVWELLEIKKENYTLADLEDSKRIKATNDKSVVYVFE